MSTDDKSAETPTTTTPTPKQADDDKAQTIDLTIPAVWKVKPNRAFEFQVNLHDIDAGALELVINHLFEFGLQTKLRNAYTSWCDTAKKTYATKVAEAKKAGKTIPADMPQAETIQMGVDAQEAVGKLWTALCEGTIKARKSKTPPHPLTPAVTHVSKAAGKTLTDAQIQAVCKGESDLPFAAKLLEAAKAEQARLDAMTFDF